MIAHINVFHKYKQLRDVNLFLM